MLSINPEERGFEGVFISGAKFRRVHMLHFDSDWARVTGLAGGTVLSMLFLAIALFLAVQ